MSESDFVLLLIVGAVIYYFYNKQQEEEKNAKTSKKKGNKSQFEDIDKIPDSEINIGSVIDLLADFQPLYQLRYSDESTIQAKLNVFFRQRIQHVEKEKRLKGSANGQIADFDLGRGAVGIEVKVASKLLKNAEYHRFLGQIVAYTSNEYKNGNLLLLVFGTARDKENVVILKQIEDTINNQGAVMKFIEIPLKK